MDDLISILSEIRSQYNCFDPKEEPYYRALSEAIGLISAQKTQLSEEDATKGTTFDCISRQAAIEALGEEPLVWDDDSDYELGQRSQWKVDKLAIESVPPEREAKLNEWCFDCKEYDQERHCCPRWNRVIRNTVEELKAEHRWIPVTERLPEEDNCNGIGIQYSDDVLMTVVNAEDEKTIIDYGYAMDGEWYSNTTDCLIPNHWKVTAWMPLPEPWDDGRNYDREFWGDEK